MARLTRWGIAHKMAAEIIPDGTIPRPYLQLARMGAANIMADAVAGRQLTVETQAQIVSIMQTKMDLWWQSNK